MTGCASTTRIGRIRRSRPRAPVTPAERFQPAAGRAARAAGAVAARQPGRRPGAAGHADRRASRRRRRRRRSGSRAGRSSSIAWSRRRGTCGRCGRQFWLGPQRAGQTVRFWADVDVIHLSIAGARVKSLRSHLSTADLAQLAREGAVAAGPPPLPPAEDGAAIEVDRAVNNSGLVGARRPPGARRRDPRRAPGDRPHRTADADVPGPADARAAARPPQPAHARASAAAARRAPRRAAAAAHGPSRSPFSAASAPPA